MAPALQPIVLAASSMILIVSCSAQLAEPPSPSTTAVASAPLELSSSGVLYSMQFRIGSTAVSGVIDTGSDLIWTNNSQLFDSPVSCPFDAGKEMGMTCCHGLSTFERKYGDNGASHVRGVMGEAKLTFELGKSSYTTPSLNIGSAVMFGCHLKDNGANKACKAYARGGIVGLGRGKLSLVKQLGLHSFSYCLPDHSSASQVTGQIKFNDTAAPLKGTQRTKLVTINKEMAYPASSRYYVKLEKIVIGATKREVKLRNGCLKSNSGNPPGMIIDSGSAFTSLPKEAFNAVKEHVDLVMGKRKTGAEPIDQAPGENDYVCYSGKYHPDRMGSIFLKFCDQAQMEIPAENYLYPESDKQSFCLAIKPQAGGEDGASILGVYQQRGMHMLFDIQHNTLSFAKHSACGESKEENHATM